MSQSGSLHPLRFDENGLIENGWQGWMSHGFARCCGNRRQAIFGKYILEARLGVLQDWGARTGQMSNFFSYLGWLQIALLVISLMSGILSLMREVVLIGHPERAKDAHLLWRCVFIAFIVSSFWLWIDEHSKLLAEHNRHEAQLDFTFAMEAIGSKTVDPKSDAVFVIAGNMTNSGEMPSIVRTWTLDVDLPDGKRLSPKPVLFSRVFQGITGETAQHIWGESFDLARDYLPDIAARTPITSGSGLPGFITFEAENIPSSTFDGLVLKYNLCYEDINHRRSCSQKTASQGINQPLEAYPGMHR